MAMAVVSKSLRLATILSSASSYGANCSCCYGVCEFKNDTFCPSGTTGVESKGSKLKTPDFSFTDREIILIGFRLKLKILKSHEQSRKFEPMCYFRICSKCSRAGRSQDFWTGEEEDGSQGVKLGCNGAAMMKPKPASKLRTKADTNLCARRHD